MLTASFNDLPYEIVSEILKDAAGAEISTGISYTFALTQASLPLDKAKTQKCVGGPARPDHSRWEATRAIREVCRTWHDWALEYALRDIYIRKGVGAERWADLTRRLDENTYRFYELNDRPRGQAVYRNPNINLQHSAELIEFNPGTASHIRRLWLNGFYTAETDALIWKVLRNCPKLSSVSLPWTLLRRGSPDDWSKLLAAGTDFPLRSLELLASDVSDKTCTDAGNDFDQHPLNFRRVNFSQLRRLKIFGNTNFMPIVDDDLLAIARSATHLEEIYIANNSTITVDGLTHLIAASRKTLRTIEHSPRSQHGFAHPHPGFRNVSSQEIDGGHICTLLTSCSHLKDLSVSIPSICPELFSTLADSDWTGNVQVRAAGLCGSNLDDLIASPLRAASELRAVLDAVRELIEERRRCGDEMDVELFFAGCIFQPHLKRVHGDFGALSYATQTESGVVMDPRLDLHRTWLGEAKIVKPSGKGPYSKDEQGWAYVDEESFLDAVERRVFALQAVA